MSWKCRTLALVAVVFLGTTDALATSAPEPRYGPCRAEHVSDGDTADLRCGAELVRVRLIHVATPNRGETGYDEASRALRALLNGRELWLAFEIPGRPTLDRDGLLLVYLYDQAGQSMNIALVSLGWATYAATDGFDLLAARFQAAESEARAEQRSMWTVWACTVWACTVGRGGPLGASER